jgi:integrase
MRGVYERETGSDIWWIHWSDAEGKRHREKVGKKRAAEKLLQLRRAAVMEGRKLPTIGRGKVTFNSLCDDAIAHSKATNGEKQTYELETRIKVLRNEFGTRPADSIKKNDVVAWLTEQSEKRSWKPASLNRWQATFSLIFRVGIENDRIHTNPAAKIRRKTEDNGRVRFLSEAEETKLLDTIQRLYPQFRPHVLLALHTGMRMSEQYSLDWNQVDLDRRQIHLGRTKNGHPRHIPLNDVAVEALNTLGPVASGPVFPSSRVAEGGSLQGSRGWFPDAVDQAGLQDFTWHCLRHTFASRLVMAGVDIRTVAELLGHRTLQMVMRYSHLAPEHQADAVNRLVAFGRKQTATTAATGRKGLKLVAAK